jgi:hypothetical protein
MSPFRFSKYLGCALWWQVTGYHRQSRVETKIHCVKLLVQHLLSRDFDRQVEEILIRAAILNGFTALGIPSNRGHGLNLFGVRGNITLAQFFQQSLLIV